MGLSLTDAESVGMTVITFADLILTTFFLGSVVYKFEQGRRKYFIYAAIVAELFVMGNFSSNPPVWMMAHFIGFLGVRLLVSWVALLKTRDILNIFISKGEIQSKYLKLLYGYAVVYVASEIALASSRNIYSVFGFLVAFSMYIHVIRQMLKFPNLPIQVTRMHGVAGARVAFSVFAIIVYSVVWADHLEANVYYLEFAGLHFLYLLYDVVLKWMTITSIGYTMWDIFCSKRHNFDFDEEMVGKEPPKQEAANPYDV